MKRAYCLAILMLITSTLACSFDLGLPDEESAADNVYFQDDFSDESSGWPRVRTTNEGMTDYENGAYRILVNLENQDYLGIPELSPQSNVRVEVDVTKVAGSDDNDFGILCRYQDDSNYYQFLVSSDGYVGILKVMDGSWQNIAAETLLEHSAVNMGNAQNHIGANCIGDLLTLYVNGQQVSTAQDSTFPGSGKVGVFAGTYDVPGADIYFDNFTVTLP